MKAIIKKYSSTRLFRDANYVVFFQACKPCRLGDGSKWNGRSTIGHFKLLSEAQDAQREFDNQ